MDSAVVLLERKSVLGNACLLDHQAETMLYYLREEAREYEMSGNHGRCCLFLLALDN